MLRSSFHRTPAGRVHPVAYSQATAATFVPIKAAGVRDLGQQDPPRASVFDGNCPSTMGYFDFGGSR
jgi:hypothetical protein